MWVCVYVCSVCSDLPRQIVASVKGDPLDSDSDESEDEHVSMILCRLQSLRKSTTPPNNHTLPAAAPLQTFMNVALSAKHPCKGRVAFGLLFDWIAEEGHA